MIFVPRFVSFWMTTAAMILFLACECRAAEVVYLSGKHIKLATDIEDPKQSQELMDSFDAAVSQWAALWQLDESSLKDWSVDACVIRDKAKFQREGLIPPSLKDFKFGYALNDRVWVTVQQSDYYTRHLLLHEGVHSLAFHVFGDAGPSWFMEGTAEMLAVHEGSGKQTVINRVPRDRDAVPFWGRFKLMSARRAAAKTPSLDAIFGYPRDLKSDVESYGWSWAVNMLLYQYPEYRSAFFDAAKRATQSDAVFNSQLKRDLQSQWPVVAARWRLMSHDLDYGFDWQRERVQLSMKDPAWNEAPITMKVESDRGWQSIGVRLGPGTVLNVTPSGRCTLADEPKPWISEPAGVTIRYFRGRPLGQLVACMVPNKPDDGETLQPMRIASITKPSRIPIRQHCWLLFRVNDAIGELADNQGAYLVQIQSGQ